MKDYSEFAMEVLRIIDDRPLPIRNRIEILRIVCPKIGWNISVSQARMAVMLYDVRKESASSS